jgi:DMSO/TMAO reductase YedYZ molybdopterin-dependent catalytic subunit
VARTLARRELPAPPEWLRLGPFKEGAFSSPLRSERLTAQLGLALGPAFAICFVTGVISHLIQHPVLGFEWPARPVQLYRVTQGLHVATGIASVPLLLAKLWSAYPRLFEWPPARDLVHAVERLSIAVLAGGAIFEVVTGLLDVARWYDPMPFFFTVAHFWTGWITIGALVVHIGVKLPVIRRALGRAGRPATDPAARRGFLAAVGAAIGVVTLATVGQTVRPLARLAVLGPRRPTVGPQGLPVNKSAVEAGVTVTARDTGYRLFLDGPRPTSLALAELRALPQYTVDLPIACVEGWSATATWTGVRLRDLLVRVGAPDGARLRVESLQRGGLYRASTLNAGHCRDPLTLLALRVGGAELDLDHGYPCRLIAPDLPGVLQTKWVARLVVLP